MGRISRRHFMGGAVAAASLGPGRLGRPARAQSSPGNPLDTFRYVVVLMLENRSFDSLLGYLYAAGESGSPFAGVGSQRCNPIPFGAPAPAGVTSVCVAPISGQQQGDYNKPYPDPGEVYPNVNTQLYNVIAPPYNVPPILPPQAPMTGFITDYINNYPPPLGAPPSYDQYKVIMECFAREAVPVLSTLAREFAVFDHWFCSVPSETLCNRAFWHAATSGGHVANPGDFSGFAQWWADNPGPTLFNLISLAPSSQGLDWRVYSSNLVSFTRLTNEIPLALYGSEHFPSLEQFFTDCANGQLKAYSFLEPLFFTPNNDQHPPSYDSSVWGPFDPGAVLLGEVLINRVYNAIRTSNSATGNHWQNTLLIITHDEHGGCFDHVPPPSATPPGGFSRREDDFAFDRLGLRVPMVMVSAYIDAGTIVNTVYEHTSFLRTMMAKWGLTWNGLPYLTQRDRQAPTFGEVFTRSAPRDLSTWPVIPDPQLPAEWLDIDYSDTPLNHLQRSILAGAAGPTANPPQVGHIATTGEALAFLRSLSPRPGANPPPHRAFWLQPTQAALGQIRSGTALRVGVAPAHDGSGRGSLKLSGVFAFNGPIDLAAAGATVTIVHGLDERGGTRELVLDGPITLAAEGRNTARTARFKTPPGATPVAEVTIGSRGRGQFTLLLDMSRVTIDVPKGRPRAVLTTSLGIDDGSNPPLRIELEQPWQCLQRGARVEYLRVP